MTATHMTARDALTVVAKIAYPSAGEQAIADERIHAEACNENLLKLLRRAKGRAHPDARGGDHALWYALEEAMKALGLQ